MSTNGNNDNDAAAKKCILKNDIRNGAAAYNIPAKEERNLFLLLGPKSKNNSLITFMVG